MKSFAIGLVAFAVVTLVIGLLAASSKGADTLTAFVFAASPGIIAGLAVGGTHDLFSNELN